MSALGTSLRERIVIEGRLPTTDAAGVRVEEWETVAKCRAAIEPEGAGRESVADALSLSQRFRVTVRRRSGLASGQRVRWKDRLLCIRQIFDDPRLTDRLTLRCEEERG